MADPEVQSVSGYTYLGCYTDTSSRILSAEYTVPIRNMPQYCCQWCVNVNTANTFCGVENGQQCFCDSTTSSVDSASASDCNSTCPGEGSVACGGLWRVGMYSATAPMTTTTASPETLTPRLLHDYSYFGCYSDSSDRILGGTLTSPSLNDPKYCCEWCINVNNNYQWCGVENGVQCFCDSTTSGPGPNSASDADCSFSCPGGGGHQCGAYWRINLYKATGVSPATTASAIPSETNTSAPQPNSKGGLSGESIAGIVVGVVAAVALFSTALFLLIRRRRSQTIPSYTTAGGAKRPAAEMLTQANIHELQAPFQPPGVELRALPESEPRIHEMDASLR